MVMKYLLLMVLLIVACTNETSTQDKTLAQNQEPDEFVSTAELLVHNTLNDCWVAYLGKVYDITDFLPKHTGSSEAIIPYCGSSEEFEKAFTQKHGTRMVQGLVSQGIYKGELAVLQD
jgi:cytochrome b involved in lipid metabolism